MAAAALLLACAAVASAAAGSHASAAPVQDAQDAVGSLDLRQAALGQQGAQLSFDVATYGQWDAQTLRARGGRSLCVTVTQRAALRVCVVPHAHGPALSLVRQSLAANGAAGRGAALPGSAQRVGKRGVRISFAVTDAGLGAGAVQWQVSSTWSDAGACPTGAAPGCTDLLPDAATVHGRIAPFRVVGCRAAGPSERLSGPAAGRRIALTFDDGPAADTPQYLSILEREHVPATFFMIGRQVAGHGALIRRMLNDGDMVGNHTWDHADVSRGGALAGSELDRAEHAIERTSGFKPCLFRPPYGARSRGLESVARTRGLLTIVWNDDTNDWRLPGSDRIYSTAISEARPGGIILMHDGGGPRQETIQALPRIIASLRARGYRFATVTDLLGLKLVYG